LVEPLEERRLLAVLELADLRDDGPLDDEGYIINGVVPNHLAGFSVSMAGDLNADGFDDLLLGAPVAPFPPSADTGTVYGVYGQAGGFTDLSVVSLLDTDFPGGFFTLGIAAEDRAGFSVSMAGDVNADGFHDFLVGAPYVDRGGPNVEPGVGQGYLVFGGPAKPPVSLASLDGSNGVTLNGVVPYDRAGWSVDTAGDVNGDGFDDFLIGAPTDANYSQTTAEGQAYLVFGHDDPFDPVIPLSAVSGTRGFRLGGLAPYDQLGSAVGTVGDINGDGFDDFAVAAPYADPKLATDGFFGSGSAYVIFGGTSPALGLNVLDGTNGFRVDGFLPYERAGFSLSSAGDFNGDGFDDLLIGAPGDRDNPWDPFDYAMPSGSGRGYVVFGKATGFPAIIDLGGLDASGEGFSITGIDGILDAPDGVDYAGFSVSAAGDVDGDGFDDLILGAPYVDDDFAGELGVGESYLLFGRPDGFPGGLGLSTLTDDQGMQLLGDRTYDRAGYSVSGAGDVNGDGFADLLVGAPATYPSTNAGKSYVLFGRDFRALMPLVGDEMDNELTGDSGANVLIGAQGDDILNGEGGFDVMRGGQGDDILGIADLSFQDLDGGRGTDALRLDGAGIVLDLTTIPDNQLTGFEQIDITGSGDNTLVLGTLQEVFNLSDTSNTLLVRRDRGDVVDRGDGWTEIAPVTIDGDSYRVYEQGAATLLVQNPPPVVDLNGADGAGIDFESAFREDDPPAAIVDSDLTVTDEDDIASATATITNQLDGTDETLAVTVGATGIAADYDADTGVLTLSGTASAADYEQVLRTLTYHSAAQSPDTTDRLVEVVVSDGAVDSATATSTVTLEAVNDAPVIAALPAPALSSIDEDTTDPAGDSVAEILPDGAITDLDTAAVEAIAVISADNTDGTWQFNTGGGWTDFGSPSDAASRLLGPASMIRFIPNADFFGTASGLIMRAWDQTSGAVGDEVDTSTNGGSTAFSSTTANAFIMVTAVNDAPVLDDTASPTLSAINEDQTNSAGDTVSTIVVDGSITDIDSPISAIAITSVDETNGQWEHSSDGQVWTKITASDTSSLLLNPARRVRFVPKADFHGTATFTFRAWDQSTETDGTHADTTQNGGTTAFSAASDTAQITVLPVDDPPTLNVIADVTLVQGIALHQVALSGISDGDDGLEPLNVIATSNNHNLLPDPTVTYSSPDSTGTLTLNPVADEVGQATVTVIVQEQDGGVVARTFRVTIARAWQNPVEPLDVDNNTFIVPLDVLKIINELNNPKFIDGTGRLPIPPPANAPPPFLDVSGDGFATSLDVLLIINFLNTNRTGEGEDERAATAGAVVFTPAPRSDDQASKTTSKQVDDLPETLPQASTFTPNAAAAIHARRDARQRAFADYDRGEDDELWRALAEQLGTGL
jgi:hypothetical protein